MILKDGGRNFTWGDGWGDDGDGTGGEHTGYGFGHECGYPTGNGEGAGCLRVYDLENPYCTRTGGGSIQFFICQQVMLALTKEK